MRSLAVCTWSALSNLLDTIRSEIGAFWATPPPTYCGATLADVERLEGSQRQRLMLEWSAGPAARWYLLGMAHVCLCAAGGNHNSLWAALSHRILNHNTHPTSRQNSYVRQRHIHTQNAVNTSC